MLPLWSKRMGKGWHVFIEPKQFRLTPAPSLLKGKNIQTQVVSVFPSDDDMISAHLTSLTSCVSKYHIHKLHVTLSNAFVKYLVVPWRTDLTNKPARDAFLNYLFKDHFGEVSHQWCLKQQLPEYQQNVIASGIHQRLLNDIETWATTHQVYLTAITPLIPDAANAAIDYAKQHHLKSFWLAVVDAGRLCLLSCRHQQWQTIQQLAVASISDQIGAMMHREMVVQCLPATDTWPLLVYSTDGDLSIHLSRHPIHKISASLACFSN